MLVYVLCTDTVESPFQNVYVNISVGSFCPAAVCVCVCVCVCVIVSRCYMPHYPSSLGTPQAHRHRRQKRKPMSLHTHTHTHTHTTHHTHTHTVGMFTHTHRHRHTHAHAVGKVTHTNTHCMAGPCSPSEAQGRARASWRR